MSKGKENDVPEQDDEEDDDLALEREIAREVEETFATIPYPGDDRLVAYPDYYESADILKAFPGKHWKDLSHDTLSQHDVSIVLFSPEAFRFYLPAYMITSMLDCPEVGIFWEYTFGSLTPPSSRPRRRIWFLEYISPLNARQKGAIRRFIEIYDRGPEWSKDPDDARAIFFWQRIADLDRAEQEDAGEQDSTLLKLRKVLLGENPLSEPETREVEALEKEIAREIEEAFANAPSPEDDGTPKYAAQWEHVSEEFRCTHWRDLSLEMLFEHRRRLWHFQAEAFRFYLPAYLIAALLHADETDELRDGLFYQLMIPPDEFYAVELFMNRVKLLDAPQRRVVLRFMELWARTAVMYPEAIKERGLSFWRQVTDTPSATGVKPESTGESHG